MGGLNFDRHKRDSNKEYEDINEFEKRRIRPERKDKPYIGDTDSSGRFRLRFGSNSLPLNEIDLTPQVLDGGTVKYTAARRKLKH
jgi:hypothetical protein